MPNSLKIFLTLSMLIFLIHVLNNVRKNKLSVRNSIIWIIMGITIIICVFQVENLEVLAKLVGIKTVSNLLFFLGFIFLIYVTFDITRIISIQNKKIISLTQELALLRKGIEDENK
ncbi:MAG: DUF2304 domain-containing protein [Bacilli bacterium]|nr:DUF2304 domain-containing protein [Bacilli bacterium]